MSDHRSVSQTCEAISDMTPEECGALIKRINDSNAPADRKRSLVEFIMRLNMIGDTLPRNGKRRAPS